METTPDPLTNASRFDINGDVSEDLFEPSVQVWKNILNTDELVGENISQSINNVEITKSNYTKDTAPDNPDVGFIFTENAEMLDTNKNVSTTQAIIRTNKDGLKNLNALPIITKKLQVAGGQWANTEEDFNEFKRLNTMLIERHLSDNWSKIVFPQGFATDKAQLPTRFAEWLQKALLDNFGLVTELNSTKTGLISKSISQPTQQAQAVSGINEPKGQKVKEGIYVNQEGLTKEEQLELFDFLKPLLESQGKKTNMGPSAPIMIGLNLRWDYKRNNPEKTPVNIGLNLAGGNTSYAYYDLSIDGKPLGKITPRFVELMNKSTGIDISNYDGAIINLYTNGSLIGNHSDLEESATAEKYPVVVANIGGSGNIILGTGANETSINLKAGAGYLFGFEGKNRKIPHSTYASEVKGFLPAITISQEGKTFKTGSYRVSITMRRVMPLEPGMPTSPNIISQSSTQPSTSVDEFTLADRLTPIEQNFADGQGGRQMQSQFKGKSTMDLIISGDRTRTTRAKTDVKRMIKDYNLSKIEDLVGKVIKMTDNTGRQVYTRITKVAPFTQEYQDDTWQKEGWIKAVTDKNVGDYPYAIEFEVVNKPTQSTSVQLKKIISGGQTGVDRIGLEAGKESGIQTGGTATPGFATENGKDLTLKDFGVEEISKELQAGKSGKEFYLPRTEQNVLNSDGTVYFATDEDSAGRIATERFAKKNNKPFLLNPTAEQLRNWLALNNIETLNVAGNRGSKLSTQKAEEIKNIIKQALSQPTQAVNTESNVNKEKTNSGKTISELGISQEEWNKLTIEEKNKIKSCN
jgi:hypothetical protein